MYIFPYFAIKVIALIKQLSTKDRGIVVLESNTDTGKTSCQARTNSRPGDPLSHPSNDFQ